MPITMPTVCHARRPRGNGYSPRGDSQQKDGVVIQTLDTDERQHCGGEHTPGIRTRGLIHQTPEAAEREKNREGFPSRRPALSRRSE